MPMRDTKTEYQKFLTRKSSGGHQASKRKKGRKNLSPRNRKACHSISTKTEGLTDKRILANSEKKKKERVARGYINSSHQEKSSGNHPKINSHKKMTNKLKVSQFLKPTAQNVKKPLFIFCVL
jgi:hypothetical protein